MILLRKSDLEKFRYPSNQIKIKYLSKINYNKSIIIKWIEPVVKHFGKITDQEYSLKGQGWVFNSFNGEKTI